MKLIMFVLVLLLMGCSESTSLLDPCRECQQDNMRVGVWFDIEFDTDRRLITAYKILRADGRIEHCIFSPTGKCKEIVIDGEISVMHCWECSMIDNGLIVP